ncbi:MAG TPA: FecR domain-containing protein [Blastocatellia bacterium]|nr:FecR domain-containing protein [Blastocatellia bacterium]
MKRTSKDINETFERAMDQIRSERVDQSVVEGAAERVWAKLSNELATTSVPAAHVDHVEHVEHIRNCDDFQALIPAYLGGTLSPARSLLFEDHTHECIPCRKALKQARHGAAAVAARPGAVKPFVSRRTVRWAIAAAVVIGIGISLVSYERLGRGRDAFNMVVHAMDGQAYLVSDSSTETLTVGEKVKLGDKIRTGKDAEAVVQLPDGSLIEMRERSEFSVTDGAQGTTIHLDRGNIIVQAAKQADKRHLYVQTEDCLVSVVGTIFSVNNGTKGSRVSVVEGRVDVQHGGKQDVLQPGDQVTTSTNLESVPIKDEIAWSRNADRYKRMLAEVAALRKEVDARAPRPGVRYSTRLLDMTPDDTVFYVAIPNLTEMIAESNKIIEERLGQNPELREWWNKEQSSARGKQEWDKVIGKIAEFGEQIGDEIVVSAQLSTTGKTEPDGPLVLTTVKDPSGFRGYVERQLASLATESRKQPGIRFVDDPVTAAGAVSIASAGAKDNADLFVWMNGDVLAASPKLEFLRRVATTAKSASPGQYAEGSFRSRIADVYHEGAGFVIAADLQKIIARTKGEDLKTNKALDRLGITNLKYFIAEMKEDQGKSFNRAVLSFSDSSHGIASWLAAPGPMGALEFISPDANVVGAFVVKQPAALVDDLLGALNTVDPKLGEHLGEFEKETGLNIREDFAAPLGGEFAFAIDGPLLPTPSWKLVLEVYDPAHLQQTFERVVDKLNEIAAREGKRGFAWESTEIGGRSYYTLKSMDFGLEVSYCYSNGYMIAGPSRALIDRAVKYHDSGYTLLSSPRFVAALPEDKQANFSAVIYQNLTPVLGGIAKRVGGVTDNLPEEQRQGFKSLLGGPVLAYAYAEGDRITFALNGEEGPIGLKPSSLIGMPGSFGLRNIIEHAVR